MFIDKERQKDIEKHFKNKGYKSFNEYIISLVDADRSGRKIDVVLKTMCDGVDNFIL